MMLRIQKERFADAAIPAGDEYFREFGLTTARLAQAKPDAIVMHPQPMNRGVEIESAVADGPQSVIRLQVANGVAVRMAALEVLAAPLAREGTLNMAGYSASKEHRGTIFVEDAKILSQESFPGQQYVLRLAAPETAARATRGQLRACGGGPGRPDAPAAVHHARGSRGGLDRAAVQDPRPWPAAPGGAPRRRDREPAGPHRPGLHAARDSIRVRC